MIIRCGICIKTNTLHIAIIGLTLALGLRSPVMASEDEAKSNQSNPPPRKNLYLNHIDAFFELEGEINHSKITSTPPRGLNFGRSQRNREWRFEVHAFGHFFFHIAGYSVNFLYGTLA